MSLHASPLPFSSQCTLHLSAQDCPGQKTNFPIFQTERYSCISKWVPIFWQPDVNGCVMPQLPGRCLIHDSRLTFASSSLPPSSWLESRHNGWSSSSHPRPRGDLANGSLSQLNEIECNRALGVEYSTGSTLPTFKLLAHETNFYLT